jgi:hypothetical protein
VYAGHAAIATFVKGVRPRIKMAVLVPVAFAPDWVDWIAAACGSHDRMISHSLLSVGIGATLAAAIYLLVTREFGDACWIWMTYASHWPADFITGIKPTWPGGPEVGLMLYDHTVWDVVLESVLIVLCWLVYRRTLTADVRRRAMTWFAPIGLIALQIVSAAIQGPILK